MTHPPVDLVITTSGAVRALCAGAADFSAHLLCRPGWRTSLACSGAAGSVHYQRLWTPSPTEGGQSPRISARHSSNVVLMVKVQIWKLRLANLQELSIHAVNGSLHSVRQQTHHAAVHALMFWPSGEVLDARLNALDETPRRQESTADWPFQGLLASGCAD